MILSNIKHALLRFDQLMVIAVLLCTLSSCQTHPHQIDRISAGSVLVTDLEYFIERKMAALTVPGLSVAIIRDGAIVYQGAFGLKNVATGEKITEQTLFEAASLSKPVFAYFVMLQVKKGLLELDRPLHKYLPNEALLHDPRYKTITARMILTHTSGLPNWRSDTGGVLKLLFTPGTEFHYSAEGYEYLKEVLKHELSSDDEGLQNLFQRDVVGVIGAQFLKYTWDETIPSRKAFGHRKGLVTDNDKHDRNFGASYSLHTTPADYAKFLIAVMRPLASNKSIMDTFLSFQNEMPNEEGELHRSLGFPLKQTANGLRFYHSGNNGDFRAYCHFYKQSGNGIVIFANSDNLFSSNLAQEIVEFLGDTWFYM